jgi:hypothetical protein
MAKHTLKEILGIFASHVGHTHEAAVQATYDAGHRQGLADAAATFKAELEPTPVPPTDGEKTNGHEEAGKAAQGQGAPQPPPQQEGGTEGSGSGERQADAPG